MRFQKFNKIIHRYIISSEFVSDPQLSLNSRVSYFREIVDELTFFKADYPVKVISNDFVFVNNTKIRFVYSNNRGNLRVRNRPIY
jgi:hypothetical protein